ncbi:MAG: hypothetical protein MJ252_06885 [archaeon]|nr:hypothetical protein [archaeon]
MSSIDPTQMQAVIESFKDTLSADKKKREEAEAKLKEIENNFVFFVSTLLDFIKIPPTNPAEEQLKLSMLLHINRILKKKVLDEKFSNQYKIEAIKKYIVALLSPNLPKKILTNLNEGFIGLIESVENASNIFIEIMTLIVSELQNFTLSKSKGIIKMLDSISNADSVTKDNFSPIYSKVFEACRIIITNLINDLSKPENSLETSEANFLLLYDNIGEFFQMLYSFAYTIKKRFWKVTGVKTEMPKAFADYALQGFQLLFSLVKDERIISWTGKGNIDKQINLTQGRIFKFVNYEMGFLEPIIADTNVINNFNQIANKIINNLSWIIQEKIVYINQMDSNDFNPTGNEPFPNYRYSNIISNMFAFLIKFLQNDTFRTENEKNLPTLFKDIILPFLMLTKQEEESCKKNEECFVETVNDALFTHKSNNIKSACGLLIKTIFNRSKDTSAYICRYAISIICNVLGKQGSSEDHNGDRVMQMLTGQNERIIDLSLFIFTLILSIKNDSNENKAREVENIKNCFSLIYSDLLMNNNHEIYVKHKCCLFIKAFTFLLSPDEAAYNVMMKALFNYLFTEKEILITKETAEVISQIINRSKDFKLEQSLPFINDLMPLIADNISKYNCEAFFDVLFEIVVLYDNKNFWGMVFSSLCKRVAVEYEKHKRLKFKVSGKKTISYDYKILINKCWNIIRRICEEKEFVLGALPQIEESLKPLFAYMKKDIDSIDFDEDLVLIMTNIIKFNESVPNVALEFLIDLYKYPEKNKGMLLDLYELLNNYIIFSKGRIEEKQEYLMAIYKIYEKSTLEIKFAKSPFFICLILQIWFMNTKNINIEMVQRLVDNSIDFLNSQYSLINTKGKEIIKNKVFQFNYSGYLGLLYTAFINYPGIVYQELGRVGKNESIILWAKTYLDFPDKIPYISKMISISVSKIIMDNINVGVHPKLFYQLNTSLLCNQRKVESCALKKAFKNDIKCDFIESDDEDNNEETKAKHEAIEDEAKEEDEDEDSEEVLRYDSEKEIKDLIDRTLNPFKNEDEYKIFKTAYTNATNNYPQIIQDFLASLTDSEKNTLQLVLSMSRIDLEKHGSTYSVPRKILKIKNNKK